MGIYRATLNQPEARAGKTAWFDDNSQDTRMRVVYGHLVPVDETAKNAQVQIVVVESPKSKQDRIREALAAARASNAANEEISSVETAVQRDAPEAKAEEAVDLDDPALESSPSSKSRPGIKRKD